MENHPSQWQLPHENEQYNPMYSQPTMHAYGPMTRTLHPVVTTTSVVALKYKDGIMMAADNLASYGSLARFRSVERLAPVGTHTIIGAGGDYSDFLYLKQRLESVMIKEHYADDGHILATPNIYEYLFRLMYGRRSKIDPLWLDLVVGGVTKGEKFLGYINLKGLTFQSSSIATGYGAYIAQPILRKAVEGKEDTLTEEEAIKIINTCMRVLFYRDARALNKLQRAKVTEAGVEITEPYSLDTEWSFASDVTGY
jgi:20S proteasome subunit beta 7